MEITAPTLALAVGPTTYPPELDCSLDETVLVGDTLVLEWAGDVRFSSIVGTASNTIDSGEASAHAASFAGLSDITSGTHYFRAHVERSGNDPSPNSSVVIHGEAEDATPAAFSFTDVNNVTAGSTQTSAEVTPTGFNVPVEITVSGGSYAIDTGAGYGSFTTSAGTLFPGDKVKARHTASASPATVTNTVVTIGGVSDTFTSTTASSFTNPTDDPTAVHWYDASNETTGVTGTGASLSLRDLIGTHHLTTDAGNAPVTGDASKDVNGLNTIYFDGTRKLWVPAANGIVFPENFHLFHVWYHDPSAYIGTQILCIGDYSDSNPLLSIGDGGGGSGILLRVTNTGMGFTGFNRTAGAPSTGVHILEVWATDNATLSISLDGEAKQDAPGIYTGFGGAPVSLQFFNRAGLAECSGRACETIVCNAPRTGGERAQIFNYLKTKWGTP
ncbi:MAG: hypothetical protein JNM03_09615 [Sphingopyxis sp.]|uniref:hypothetical protein n=1 Tax=Sphingopyxis sp. TaxID=1908224 RepID=UPI001A513210|nr:hypothetical protein [Sphingopyxis sp.]MBL9070235.1 hypothetical protein [Sphingopyxis sp.]